MSGLVQQLSLAAPQSVTPAPPDAQFGTGAELPPLELPPELAPEAEPLPEAELSLELPPELALEPEPLPEAELPLEDEDKRPSPCAGASGLPASAPGHPTPSRTQTFAPWQQVHPDAHGHGRPSSDKVPMQATIAIGSPSPREHHVICLCMVLI
jgi:hypothetical protein